MRPKPYTWSRKPTAARRACRAAAENLKARARQAAAKLRGHQEVCRTCGKTVRTKYHLAEHIRRTHGRTQDTTRTKAKAAPVPFKGREVFTDGNGKRYRNRLQFNDHARQQAERAQRAEDRRQEQARRTAATQARTARLGRPAAPPKDRMQDKARRTLQANGRLDANGKRIPHTPHPKVRFRTPQEPAVK